MPEIRKIDRNTYLISKQDKMRIEAVLFLSDKLFQEISDDESMEQLVNAASLPGLFKHVVGMPDIHSGFGLPIGGIMASDACNGVVSAGAVGMDINCGVRLLMTNIHRKKTDKNILRKLMDHIEKRVPTGIGKSSKYIKKGSIVNEVMHEGAQSLIRRGLGRPQDRESIEEYGCLQGADLSKVSREALSRSNQLATIGGGNHFIEIGFVSKIFEEELASFFGLEKDYLTVLIHTGSRGFGHQICTDYTKIMLKAASKYGIELPSRGLACAPIDSDEGRDYLSAMACAVNFAFGNRQLITHEVREAFGEVFKCEPEKLGLELVYDLAHNIAKFEEHFGRKLLVHRKGATRALPPGHESNPAKYLETGHPVLIPGSMGTASYVVVGTAKNNVT
ncbi:MAG: RNA-splicing ligase RtcB, partial [Firmicutes bacterium HGW-Firmicutes-13]